jgi:hypothetical protein
MTEQPACPLDVAWRDAEAALPDGWALSAIGAFDGSGDYLVSAMSRAGRSFALTGRPTDEGLVAEGQLVDALRDITAQVRRIAPTTVGGTGE